MGESPEQVLREVFAEQAAPISTTTDLYAGSKARERRRRRALVSAAAAAAVVVGAAVPVGLTLVRSDGPPETAQPGPAPAGDPCLPQRPLVPPVPADQLRRQSGVRGSLGTDSSVVDAAAVAAWQGMQTIKDGSPEHDPDPQSVRVVFVERAGAGSVALVTGQDRAGDSRVDQWVAGRDRRFVPTASSAGSGMVPFLPLGITSQEVCGRDFGVVVAPPAATAVLATAPRIGADGRPDSPATRPLPLADGVAVFPIDHSARTKVTVSRSGAAPVSRQLSPDADNSAASGRLLLDSVIARAVGAGGGAADQTLTRLVARTAIETLVSATADEPTGLRLLWGGPAPGGLQVVVVGLTLPSGATYVEVSGTVSPHSYSEWSMDDRGLLPAGALDGALLTFGRTGRLVVVAPRATRAEVVLADGTVLPVSLTGGGADVDAPGATVTLVRVYRADGSLLASSAPRAGLLPLPGSS